MHSLHRNGKLIEISEFKNVIGRAGRAYVDVEGVVLFPMFDDIANKRRKWEALITDLGAREMESGLVQLVAALLTRMRARIGGDLAQLVEYVVNNAEAWTFPEVANEAPEDRERALTEWERHVSTLDTAILSLIGENDIPDHGIEAALDDILQSSLWQRRLLRQNQQVQEVLNAGILSRSRLIWARSTAPQRRGLFSRWRRLDDGPCPRCDRGRRQPAARPGQCGASGRRLRGGDYGDHQSRRAGLRLLSVHPDPMPENWRDILRCWLLGQPLAGITAGEASDTLQFIEGGLVYRLPWAMEAVRVRALANGDVIEPFGLALDDHELRLTVPAVETGTMNRSASILIQAGFNSRLAAIKAVTDTASTFTTGQELRLWLNSDAVASWNALPDWPTAETKEIWAEFAQTFTPRENRTWTTRRYRANVAWQGASPPPGAPVTLYHWNGQPIILSMDGLPLGILGAPLNPNRRGLTRATISEEIGRIDLSYLGPDDMWQA
jgi:hypothetical protein